MDLYGCVTVIWRIPMRILGWILHRIGDRVDDFSHSNLECFHELKMVVNNHDQEV